MRGRRASIVFAIAAVAALAVMLISRIISPTDLWDQTQPRTIAYTTDILVNGNWVLPAERGEAPATKPPMYNWIAAPIVWVAGFSSELAHKSPSVLALLLSVLLVVFVGGNLASWAPSEDANPVDDTDRRGADLATTPVTNPMTSWAIGWLAALMLICSYPLFKLGYLARPDMLLVLWLTLGWALATIVLQHAARAIDAGSERDREATKRRFMLVAAFWLCVGCAGLTKGPPAILLVFYALLGGRTIAGRWKATVIFGWWWGLPLAILMVAAWLGGAIIVDAEHVNQVLWYDEIYGRVTGVGPEGSTKGPIGFITDLGYMPLYFIARFAPWSVLAILGMIELFCRDRENRTRHWQILPRPMQCWLLGALLFVCITVGFFSLSTGKRADYIAPCYPMAALLASWWWLGKTHSITWLSLGGPLLAAGIAMTALVINDQQRPAAPSVEFCDAQRQFVHEATRAIDASPGHVYPLNAGPLSVLALLGISEPDSVPAIASALDRGEQVWLVVGGTEEPRRLLLRHIEALLTRIPLWEIVVETAEIETRAGFGWPGQLTLYRASAADSDPSKAARKDG